jgi:hypothetical protein
MRVFDSGATPKRLACSNCATLSDVKSHLFLPPVPLAYQVAMSRSVQNRERKIGICTSIGRQPDTGDVPCFL